MLGLMTRRAHAREYGGERVWRRNYLFVDVNEETLTDLRERLARRVAGASRTPVVEAPTGVAVFPHEVILLPQRWANAIITEAVDGHACGRPFCA